MAILVLGVSAAAGPVSASALQTRIVESAVTLSQGGLAEFRFQLEDASEHWIRFSEGHIESDEQIIASFEDAAWLAAEWRSLLRDHLSQQNGEATEALLSFAADLRSADERPGDHAAWALAAHLEEILSQPTEEPAQTPALGERTLLHIAPGGLGLEVAELFGTIEVRLAELDPAHEWDQGRLALIVHDNYMVEAGSSVDGHLVLVDGELEMAGAVHGNAIVLDGVLELVDGHFIDGDLVQFGGAVEGVSANLGGEILENVAVAELASATTPGEAGSAPEPARTVSRGIQIEAVSQDSRRSFWVGIASNFGRAVGGVADMVGKFLVLAIVGIIGVRLFQRRIETVAETFRHEYRRSLVFGIVIAVLSIFAFLLGPILYPLMGLAALMGYIAAAHAIGEIVARRAGSEDWTTKLRRRNSYSYVVTGLALLLLPFAIEEALWVFGSFTDMMRTVLVIVSVIGTLAIGFAGFGAVILTRAGGRATVVSWSDRN